MEPSEELTREGDISECKHVSVLEGSVTEFYVATLTDSLLMASDCRHLIIYGHKHISTYCNNFLSLANVVIP